MGFDAGSRAIRFEEVAIRSRKFHAYPVLVQTGVVNRELIVSPGHRYTLITLLRHGSGKLERKAAVDGARTSIRFREIYLSRGVFGTGLASRAPLVSTTFHSAGMSAEPARSFT